MRAVLASMLALATACSWFDAPTPKPKAEKKDEKKADNKKKDDDVGDVVRGGPGPRTGTYTTLDQLDPGEPALVMLVVMDTVRADHTQLCGYEKPNTPNLVRYLKSVHAWTCDAYSPAAWTLPSHASYFTGLRTSEHGIHDLGGPLKPEFETLAERFAARGYQTLFLSANPVFSKAAGGFWQGFDQVFSADALRGPMRDDLDTWLRTAFEGVDDDKPLFIVLNIFDAHDPYPEVPAGLDWAEKQDALSLHPHTADASSPYFQYVTGAMPEDKKAPFLEKVRNAYDHAVSVADHNLGMTIRGLRERGWIDRPHRIVITSDHGEHLGEHQLLRHGSAVWQTVIRVPFLYFDNVRTEPLTLPQPMSATTAFHLLSTGELPSPALPVEAASARNPEDFKPSWDSVAWIAGPHEKLMMMDGAEQRFDLAADPLEMQPLAVSSDHPAREAFLESVHRHAKSVEEALKRPVDEAVMEMLRSVGYVQ